MLYSFDIFDTCITRTFFRPTDLFYQLFKNLNPNFTPEDIYDLVRLRIKAESEARSFSDKEDINLQEIYDRLDITYYGLECQTVKQAELDLEFKSLRPIKEIQTKIECLRQNGHKIIFISDMYLPTEHIQKILIYNNIAQITDIIYISGQIGLTKATGNLFKYVLQTENISSKQLHHTGDNIYSDIIIPQKLGIKTNYVRAILPTRYEEKAFNETIAPIEIRSQISGISRAVRLQETDPNQNNKEIVTIAANIIAPLLTSYVTWVLQDAEKRGIEKLYFVSRDGQVLLKIAQQLSHHFPTVELRYLYGSRQAWFLPSITEVKQKTLDWVLIDGQSKLLIHLLKKFNISYSEIASYLKQNGDYFDNKTQHIDQSNLQEFWNLLESKEISTLILEKAKISRQECISYFEQNGLFSNNKWAIVDLGWTLKCQRSLQTLLKMKNENQEVLGYYFALFRESLLSKESGQYKSFFLQDLISRKFKYSLEEVIFRHQNIIEQIFTIADHPSTVGYQTDLKDNITYPLYTNTQYTDEQIKFTKISHSTILKYAQEISKINPNILINHLDTIKQISLYNTILFLTKPSFNEVKSVANLVTFDDQNNSQKRPLARSLRIKDLAYFLFKLLGFINKRNYQKGLEWLEGSIALSNLAVRLLYSLFQYLSKSDIIALIYLKTKKIIRLKCVIS